MTFTDPPGVAAWLHREARTGFEVAGIRQVASGWAVDGCTSAVEDGEAWVVDYEIELSTDWITRRARATRRVGAVTGSVTVEGDGQGHWTVDGAPRPDLTGCLDVDLESSALTNAFPVHRLALATGQSAEAPACYVRASLVVERLEQSYRRIDSRRFHYRAPIFDFESHLTYDASGFALDYPGIAVRAL